MSETPDMFNDVKKQVSTWVEESPRPFLMGVAAGLRSQTPLAVLAHRHGDAPEGTPWRSWPVFRSANGRTALALAAAGEMIADKSPFAPARIKPGPLFGRAAFGALAGAAIEGEHPTTDDPLRQGAMIGAVGAVAGSVGGYLLRTVIVKVTPLPDGLVALGEDALAIALARKASR